MSSIWLEPCPDSVWHLLPGGPAALNERFGEYWQYHGTKTTGSEERAFEHCFRHRAHPDYDDRRIVAFVQDDDAGPRLHRLVSNGQELPLPREAN
jgi:hypothetical protein